ncbi:MAG: glycosyltransferase family 2 protein [Chloroflexi bacterium]|nr:glycosyltransferase family 2 protein [Chloroflexota bacterium]
MTLLALVHAVVALWLAIYGLNSFILVFLYLRHRREVAPTPPIDQSALPAVTVQVPVYNELHVVERVIDSVAALDYPRDRLQIQILDDSTDETTCLARARAVFHREQGVDITVLRRPDRSGFKAGALAWGLSQARGEYVAIFDADFCPHPDFLLQTVPHFLAHPRLGMVQTRWSYLNADYSPLTRAQALALDGHFVVEQSGRHRSGLLMNFNGTAGVWRRCCIEECGGWQADTLSEDLDLSYRAQLAGWECLYLPTTDAPAELPPQIAAFKRQQSRWAQGSVQTLRKLAWPLLRDRRLRWGQKVMALVHLSSYLAHALMLVLLLASLPLLLMPDPAQLPLSGLGLMCLGPPLVYAISQQQTYPDWGRRLWAFPLLVLIGIGIAWCNTQAVWRGLTRWGGSFARTPKFRLEGQTGRWADSSYRLKADSSTFGEVVLALYALTAAVVALVTGRYGMMPFLLLYAAAFGTVAGIGLAQTFAPRRSSPLRPALRGLLDR